MARPANAGMGRRRAPLERAVAGLPARAGVAHIDLLDADAPLRLDGGGLWHVTAFAGPRPLGHRWLDAPARVLDPQAVRVLFAKEVMAARRMAIEERLRRRLAPDAPAPPATTVTVAVCTRRRPAHVERLLAGLAALDPAPLEILVIDNDPGELDVRALAGRFGARYVHAARAGLNRARRIALAEARGDVIAFVDDDCRVPPGWLAPVDRLFAMPEVAIATGPALPATLDTPAQIAFEQLGGFGRGYEERTADWRTLPPSSATSLGSGNNLLLRRSAAAGLRVLFPPELDAGTATASGGDLYAMAALLHDGGRIVFSPDLWVSHEHREDAAGLDTVIRGYGVGLGAALLALARDFRDPETVITARWLWTQLHVAASRRIAGRTGSVGVAGAVTYVAGAAAAPRALRAARRALEQPA